MPQFSGSEIDEAKKRVREMQERTRNVAEKGTQTLDFDKLKSLIDLLTPLKENERDPLTLIALVSALKDNADTTLILALIYILLL
ncbi:MAG: hypothetical protein IJ872_02265 [Eubacterium sp.]|nr:hypothetical protein [Eubacterium sp.]